MAEDNARTWIDKAFKKLKGSVYFDKTQLPLLNKLVCFEDASYPKELDRMAALLENGDEAPWADYTADIIDKIDALAYPKKLRAYPDNQVIFNLDNEPIEAERVQYFIDLPIEGHILGVLWVLTVGALLDNRMTSSDEDTMYVHSYGNRLRKNLYDSDDMSISYPPYLFEPYFSQYENWRDRALAYAKERLDDKQDALILTLDLRSFFYSVHIPKDAFDEILSNDDGAAFPPWVRRVHDFVYHVMEAYSNKLRTIHHDTELDLGNRVFLPIGFLPSNILSNWVLTPFDEAINQRFNPVYYGRYVDDIIIVDKVEKNSPLRKKAKGTSNNGSKLTTQDIIAHYFCSCLSSDSTEIQCKAGLFTPLEKHELTKKQTEAYVKAENTLEKPGPSAPNPALVYRINTDILPGNSKSDIKSDIQIQNDKVKVFYFREGATRALLDCFRTQIGQNASEFRFLPDLDRVLGNNDYSEIFKLQSDETLHKLRGVSSASLDRFSLSKFLGKYRKASGMIRDKKENAFERDLFSILSKRALIDNYTLWERLLEILIVNDNLDSFEKLAKNILDAIAAYDMPENLVMPQYKHQALLHTLQAAILRTSALCWGQKVDTMLEKIEKVAQSAFPDEGSFLCNSSEKRKQFCRSCMVNKYVLPLPIHWVSALLFEHHGEKTVNLCHIESFLEYADWAKAETYILFPYIVTPQEISYALACRDMAKQQRITSPDAQQKEIKKLYLKLNYDIDSENCTEDAFPEVKVCPMNPPENVAPYPRFAISVESAASKKIKVAIGNARLIEKDFKLALTGKPNRSFERYRQISKLVKEAITAKADLLVLPENFLPWEWVPDIVRICANSQLAIITGIEHILSDKENGSDKIVYNLTAVILPYCKDDYKFAHVVYHQKVHFSPNELRQIKGYRMEAAEGRDYQLFCWKDLWFSVYCCYELASIVERSLFQSYADLTVAVEWNKDVAYFSSIVESLCRDLHCYCVQANSSDYGDSRVLSPSRTELRDIIKTKGGINYTILMDEIDIDALREHQRMEYELQRDSNRFKPTPPNFQPDIVEHKQNGTLWQYIKTAPKMRLFDIFFASGE